MAGYVSVAARETMLTSISGSDLTVALLNNSFSAFPGFVIPFGFSSWASISAYEVTGSGYTPGGASLSAISIGFDPEWPADVWYNGSNIIWNTVTLETCGLVLYRKTSGLVIEIVQFSEPLPKSSISGPFSISWTDGHLMDMITG